MKQLPNTVKGLLDELDRLNPHRCPTPDMSDREIWMSSGKRDLIDTLLTRYRYKPGDTTKEEFNFVQQ